MVPALTSLFNKDTSFNKALSDVFKDSLPNDLPKAFNPLLTIADVPKEAPIEPTAPEPRCPNFIGEVMVTAVASKASSLIRLAHIPASLPILDKSAKVLPLVCTSFLYNSSEAASSFSCCNLLYFSLRA